MIYLGKVGEDIVVLVVVAEWLRRSPLGSPRARSNPADYEELLSCFLALISQISTCLEMILFDLNQLIPLNLQRKLESFKRGTAPYLVTYPIIFKNFVL